MGFETPKMLTPEEMAKINRTRSDSDKEFDSGGADIEYDQAGKIKRLSPTQKQIEKAKEEMEENRLTPEKMAEINSTRMDSDKEFDSGGADIEYDQKGEVKHLSPTQKQIEKARIEMKNPEAIIYDRNTDEFKVIGTGEVVDSKKLKMDKLSGHYVIDESLPEIIPNGVAVEYDDEYNYIVKGTGQFVDKNKYVISPADPFNGINSKTIYDTKAAHEFRKSEAAERDKKIRQIRQQEREEWLKNLPKVSGSDEGELTKPIPYKPDSEYEFRDGDLRRKITDYRDIGK